jgi:hypothetical protein
LFRVIPREDQKRLSAEQFKFAFAVFRAYPAPFVEIALRNFVHIFTPPDYVDFNYPDWQRAFLGEKLPPSAHAQQEQTLSWQEAFPTFWFATAGAVIALLSLGYIILRYRSLDTNLKELAILAMLFILANNLLCALGSGVYTRYFARVIWLLPFVATIIAIRLTGPPPASPR